MQIPRPQVINRRFMPLSFGALLCRSSTRTNGEAGLSRVTLLPCQPLANIKVPFAFGASVLAAQGVNKWTQNPEGTSGWPDSERWFILITVVSWGIVLDFVLNPGRKAYGLKRSLKYSISWIYHCRSQRNRCRRSRWCSNFRLQRRRK